MERKKEPSFQEIAVLFTDVVSSTEYFKRYGDDKGRRMLKTHVDIVSPYISLFDGVLVKTVGDSVMAYFEDPRDALAAAISIQKKFEGYRIGKGEEEQIHIRIGIDYGKTLIEDGDIFGDVVNIASRLTELCEVDGILISENIFSRVSGLPNLSFSLFSDSKNIDTLRDIMVYRVSWKEEASFEPKKRVGIFLNFLPPLSAEKGRELLGSDVKKDLSPFHDLYSLREDSIFLLPKEDLPIGYCLKKLFPPFSSYCARNNIRGFLPLRVVIDAVSPRKSPGPEEESAIPWYRIGPGEILISMEAKGFLGEDLILHEEPLFDLRGQKSYFRMKWPSQDGVPFPEKDFRDVFLIGENPPCFYCGDRRHRPDKCPSKKILDLSPKIEEIGYMPEEEINRAFLRYLTCGTRALEEIAEGKGSGYYETLEKFHFAFFEPKKVFQLRFLKLFLDRSISEWEEVKKRKEGGEKGGLLWIAIDALRVSDYKRAYEIIKKAEEEIGDSFATFCLKGFYYMERGEEESARGSFYSALKSAKTKAEKAYVLFLLSRLSYVHGDTKKASELVKEAVNLAYDSIEARYFDLILGLRSSGFFERERGIYVSKLLRIPERHREYYIYLLLDPELAPFYSLISEELKKIRISAEKDAESLLSKSKDFFDLTKPLLSDKEIEEISSDFEKANKLKEKGGYFAFLDVKEMCKRTLEKMEAIRGRRMGEIRDRTIQLKKRFESLKIFFETYPYGFFVRNERDKLRRILEKIRDLESASSFSTWEKEATKVENEIVFLEKRLKTAEEILYGLRLLLSFLKASTFLLLLLSFLCFFVFPFFSDRLKTFLPFDFPYFQRTFLIGGILFTLSISFYFAIRRTRR